MCGIVGVIGNPLPTRKAIERMRDAMSHRGPDDAGLWVGPGVSLGHRRLSVIDPGPSGHQPMVSADGRFVLAYNGELYNDDELCRRLSSPPDSRCDTATLLAWLAEGRDRADLRGMYAFALVDTHDRTLTLARDPLGVKPLFWTRLGGRVAFASEIQALFQHPDLSPLPDPLGVSMYLSSVRTVMGSQTMFAGVHAIEPGQSLIFQLDDTDRPPREERVDPQQMDHEPDFEELRWIVNDSITAHLRTDVELCAMLSGGLDSTIIVQAAHESLSSLRTYCAGIHADEGDPAHAMAVAEQLGIQHYTSLLDEQTFCSLWLDGIARTGSPLATPNETAIRLIARSLRNDGNTVTLSGEGADELFAGYEGPLKAARGGTQPTGGRHELEANAWIPSDIKPTLLVGDFGREASDASPLVALFESAFERAVEQCGEDGLAAHLCFQRLVNLPMLLHRLDAATMLESVEGRTPFADMRMAAAAASIPVSRLFDEGGSSPAQRTKLALREAFRGQVPTSVMNRTKASFPLPFERWMQSVARFVRRSDAGASIVQPALVAAIAEAPERHWHLAWPVFNIVLWAERWWGNGLDNALDRFGHASAASTRGTAASSRFV
ncbi:MAG: asparagine synthase (glutamine-hydrolyzing) [Planctomycetota bacterium]